MDDSISASPRLFRPRVNAVLRRTNGHRYNYDGCGRARCRTHARAQVERRSMVCERKDRLAPDVDRSAEQGSRREGEDATRTAPGASWSRAGMSDSASCAAHIFRSRPQTASSDFRAQDTRIAQSFLALVASPQHPLGFYGT